MMSLLPTEMTHMDLVAKCLDFSQALALLDQTTSLSINIESPFSFNLDTRVKSTTLDTVKQEAPDTRRPNISKYTRNIYITFKMPLVKDKSVLSFPNFMILMP